jgi:hypothetical protein
VKSKKDESSEWDERDRRQSDEGRSERTRVVSEFSIKRQNEKQKSESGTQEDRKENSRLLLTFFTAGLQNSGEFGKTADHYL